MWDEHALRWNYVRPGQDWEDGEVTSPTELEQCRSEKELLRALQVPCEQGTEALLRLRSMQRVVPGPCLRLDPA